MTYGEPPSPARLRAGRAWLKWVRRDAQLYTAYRAAGSRERWAARKAWRDHAKTQPRTPSDDVLAWIRRND